MKTRKNYKAFKKNTVVNALKRIANYQKKYVWLRIVFLLKKSELAYLC